MLIGRKPIFGICLGHQLLGLALGGTTSKMHPGHHGANHPEKALTTGKVEITSMNHGFAVDTKSLPAGVTETHVSLFDGSNAGLSVDGKPIFLVLFFLVVLFGLFVCFFFWCVCGRYSRSEQVL